MLFVEGYVSKGWEPLIVLPSILYRQGVHLIVNGHRASEWRISLRTKQVRSVQMVPREGRLLVAACTPGFAHGQQGLGLGWSMSLQVGSKCQAESSHVPGPTDLPSHMFLGREGRACARGQASVRSRVRADPRVDQNKIESKGRGFHMRSEDSH